MRILRVAVAVALLAGASPARATDPAPNKCGGTYANSNAKSCDFYFKGVSLILYGDSEATNAQVRVWITIEGYPQAPLLECQAEAAGSAHCDGGVPDETTHLDLPHQAAQAFVHLRCHVEGRGSGLYQCQAGS
jgi:hypothetical protein